MTRDSLINTAIKSLGTRPGHEQCKVCTHPHVSAIHRELIRGASQAKVAARFGLKPLKLWHHIRKGHHLQQMERMDRDARMVRLEALDDSVRAVAEEVLSILRKHDDPDVQLRAVGKLLASQELHAKLTGRISTGPINQFLVQLGVKNEAELKSALALKRAGESVTLRDAFDDALALVKMGLIEHPEWKTEVLDVVGHVVGTNGTCASSAIVVE